jgi:myo-inositol 2-dehydrogenase/D-chiro-inositol 1-dehydrogenase
VRPELNRRRFFDLAGAAVAAGGPVIAAPPSGPVRVGLVGCGGRGVYDATGLVTQAGAQVVALADLFQDKLDAARRHLDTVLNTKGMPPIAADRLYRGAQSALRLAESDLDAVLLALPPYFYPETLEAIAGTGKHIYCEKPVGIDVPGCLKVLDVARRLDGKVVFHVGLQVPWAGAFQEMTRRIHAEAIGTIATAQSYFYFPGGGRKVPPGMGRDEARIRTWAGDRVLSGDIIVEQNVHALDKVNGILKDHPISAFAKASRKARTDFGDIRDNFEALLTYPGNVSVSFHSTQFLVGYADAGERFFGTRGVSESHYTGGVRIVGAEPWDAGVVDIVADAETNKYRAFINDIKTGNLRNEGLRGATSTLTAILVRTAADTGREVSWDALLASREKCDAHIDLRQFD